MPSIEGTIQLIDRFSPVLRSVLNSVNLTINAMEELDRASDAVKLTPMLESARAAALEAANELESVSREVDGVRSGIGKTGVSAKKMGKELNGWNTALQNANNALGVISQGMSLVQRAGAAVGSLWTKATGLSDTLTSQHSRLDMMNDGLQTTLELSERIYSAANRSRMSYIDMSESIAQMGNLAGDAFDSNAEIAAFSELLGKTFTISGTDEISKSSAMLQLTQALSSGVLQGDEFRSISEAAPKILQYIADYMGVTRGELKALSSEGVITADIIKNAILGASEKINEGFEKMPVTFGQAATLIENEATRVFKPATEALQAYLSSEQGTQTLNMLAGAMNSVGNAALYAANLATGAMTWVSAHIDQITMAVLLLGTIAVSVAAVMAVSWMISHMPLVLIVLGVLLFIDLLSQLGVTSQQIGQAIGSAFGWLYGIIYNIVADLYNLFIVFAEFFANFMNDPVGATVRLFYDLADVVLGVLQTIADAIDALFGSNLAGGLQSFRDKLSGMVKEAVGENEIKFNRMEKISTSDTMKAGAEMADSLLSGLGSGDALSGLFGNNELLGNSGGLSIEGVPGGASVGVSGEVEVAEEDIKYILDMTERRYINMINLSSPAPVVHVKFGDVHESVDVDELTSDIADSIIRSLDFVSARPEEVY